VFNFSGFSPPPPTPLSDPCPVEVPLFKGNGEFSLERAQSVSPKKVRTLLLSPMLSFKLRYSHRSPSHPLFPRSCPLPLPQWPFFSSDVFFWEVQLDSCLGSRLPLPFGDSSLSVTDIDFREVFDHLLSTCLFQLLAFSPLCVHEGPVVQQPHEKFFHF